MAQRKIPLFSDSIGRTSEAIAVADKLRSMFNFVNTPTSLPQREPANERKTSNVKGMK